MDTHRTDALSLVVGTLFLVIGLIATVGGVTFDDLRGDWLAPTLLGAAGVALLASVPFRRATSGDADGMPEGDDEREVGSGPDEGSDVEDTVG